jgi:hypothetical protein
MLQIYLLSVLSTLIGSLALVVGDLSGKLTSLVPLKEVLGGKGTKIIVGLSSLS